MKIVFVGNARDFHAMDWYRTIRKVCHERVVLFATDLIESEGHARLVTADDRIVSLYNVDRLLFRNQSAAGNVWRNLVKALAVPLQARRLRRFARENPGAIYHAHTMYYLWVCWLAGVRYIGSPQGDEILIRPHRSRVYRYFATKSLAAADHLIVDSDNLRRGIERLCGMPAAVIQYGIDVAAIRRIVEPTVQRTRIASIRALYPLYRLEEIIQARDRSKERRPLFFFYPYWEDGYKEQILGKLQPADRDLGRFPSKPEVYSFLNGVLLAVSIPMSDSSPRSVYEAIFCGCCVAVTYNPWIDALPECMKSRLCVVDLQDEGWLDKAIRQAGSVVAVPYEPSEQALDMFDQERSMAAVASRYYGHAAVRGS